MMPFTLISLAAVVSGNTNIIMLGQLSDAEQVGIYRVALQGSLLVTFSLQVVNAIITPQIAALYAGGKLAELQTLVRRSARLITLTALPAAVLLVLIGEWLIVTLFGPAYAASYLPMTALACGTLVTAMFGSLAQLLEMTGNERETARALWLTTGANVLLNFVLIPQLEALGAAIATACSVVMWNILLYRKVRSKLGINPTVLSKAEVSK
ncbi:MAG: polysaccharide biosynthesis C-terminal domain-containing protein, partial [Pseudomonadota bacterium]